MDQRPKISVCVITYNQAQYIGSCLESIVQQETTFPFEVLVADNGSSDGTAGIVSQFAARYPSIVRPILRPNNIGGSANYVLVHDEARGDDVAHLDGDDRALPGKLQRQCDVLDRLPNCTAVWHRADYFDDLGHVCSGALADISMFQNGIVSLSDAVRLGFVGVHSSLMYRRTARLPKDPAREYLDVFLTWELLSSGPGYFIDEVLGEYRVGAHGSISANSYAKVRRLAIEHAEYFLAKSPEERKNFVLFALTNALLDLRRARKTALDFLRFAIRHSVLVSPTDVIRAVHDYRRVQVPWRHQRAKVAHAQAEGTAPGEFLNVKDRT